MEERYKVMQKVMRENYNGEKAQALFDVLKKNGTWQSPTLTVLRNMAFMRERRELDKDRLTFLPKRLTSSWTPTERFGAENVDNEYFWLAVQARYTHLQRMVGEMHAAGVKIIAGTDAANPFCFPGFSLHDELELLVEAGLSPMAALQAATLNAADASGRLEELGTVEQGKIADLVLLEDNPLHNIANTRKISAVILNGRYYDRDALDTMLDEVQQKASSSW